jgi:hypothetical protein
LRLGRHLNTPSKADDPSQGIVVVVESGQDSRCLFVDELIGKQEVVIKSLGDMFHQQTNFAGAAILAPLPPQAPPSSFAFSLAGGRSPPPPPPAPAAEAAAGDAARGRGSGSGSEIDLRCVRA